MWCGCLLMWLHFTTLCMHNCASVIFYSFGGQKALILCALNSHLDDHERSYGLPGVARLLFVCRTFGAPCLIANCPIALRQQRPRGYYYIIPFASLYEPHLCIAAAAAKRQQLQNYHDFLYLICICARGAPPEIILHPKVTHMRIWIMCITWRIRLVSANLLPADHISLHAPGHFALNKYKQPEVLIYFEWLWPNRYFVLLLYQCKFFICMLKLVSIYFRNLVSAGRERILFSETILPLGRCWSVIKCSALLWSDGQF